MYFVHEAQILSIFSKAFIAEATILHGSVFKPYSCLLIKREIQIVATKYGHKLSLVWDKSYPLLSSGEDWSRLLKLEFSNPGVYASSVNLLDAICMVVSSV